MIIDRSNYEIWLIDLLDGNLNDHQAEQLFLFLNENPDLREEFEELNSFNLKPPVKSFPRKEIIKKSIADLSHSQFEYLSVGYLENDLSDEQQSEIEEVLEQDPEKKRIFEFIQKTKLTPSDIKYKHKNHLLKRTVTQKLIRMSVIGLSSAAAITLIIMTYLIIPQKTPDNPVNTAENILADTINRQASIALKPEPALNEPELKAPEIISENLVSEVGKRISDLPQSDITISVMSKDSLFRNPDNQETAPVKVSFDTEIELRTVILNNSLIASNSDLYIPADDERSNVSRFMAKIFREKILKEELSPDKPLRGYEIAEAGITGLNKLLGWEMALEKNNDEDGELRSVYFSSKILKFNAPVKKSIPVP